MEGPPTTASTDNIDKSSDPSPTWHRPTNSLPHFPSSDSQVSSPPPHFRQHSLNLFPALSSCSPPSDSIPEIETYVVQVPRDQVYWTPPPENAKIIERRLNSEPEKKKKRFCSKRLMWFLISVFVIGFIICAIALIIRFVFKPEPPVFDVKKLVKARKFEIILTSKNPSSSMWVTYKGLVSLTYKNKNIFQGKFPKLSQPEYGFDAINLIMLDWSKNAAVLPPEAVSLVLTMELNAEYGSGLLKRNKKVAVTCDVKIKRLLDAKEVEIVSESCESEFTN